MITKKKFLKKRGNNPHFHKNERNTHFTQAENLNTALHFPTWMPLLSFLWMLRADIPPLTKPFNHFITI